jgi:hypothetical protein
MERQTSYRPWVSGRAWWVPYELRTYGFDTNYGFPAPLFEEFIPVKEPNSGTIIRVDKKARSLQNPHGFFHMTYKDVDECYAEAEKTNDSLKDIFGRTHGHKLNPQQFEALAMAPDVFSAVNQDDLNQAKIDVDARIAAFKAKLKAYEDEKKKKRPQPVG